VTNKQCDEVIEALKDNGELRGSYGFNGSKPTFYGEGCCRIFRDGQAANTSSQGSASSLTTRCRALV